MLNVVCYYTNDNLYSKHKDILLSSSNKFNIKITPYEYAKGDWLKITAIKPSVIIKSRSMGYKTLYIDADAIILSDISEYFNSITEDIGVHYYNGVELLSGTLFFNNTKGADLILDEWKKRQEENPSVWDQKNLQCVIEELTGNGLISVKHIPEDFTFIFDSSNEIKKPLIEHLQASRDVKWINKFRERCFIGKIMMLLGFSSLSRKSIKRHKHINKRCSSLNIKHRFNIIDLIRK